MSEPRRRRRPRAGGRRRLPLLRIAAVLVAGALVFLLGIALGQATRDNPPPGTSVTSVRTLEPRGLPAVRETVTVTVGEG